MNMFGNNGKNSYTNEFKLKVILHYNNFGIKSTLSAFEVSKASIFNWNKEFKEKGVMGLDNKSCKPKRIRISNIDERIFIAILNIRLQYPFLGKSKVKILLDKYCLDIGIQIISESTVGRIISQLKQRNILDNKLPKNFTFEARTGNIFYSKTKNQKTKQSIIKLRRNKEEYIPKQPGDLIQIDTEEERLHGKKLYIISAIDYNSSFTFSLASKTLNSQMAKNFFKKLEQIFPYQIKAIQTDNGKEHYKHFHNYIQEKNIQHFWNYPKTPKSNGKIERYNRTIQEEFTTRYKYLITQKQGYQKLNKELINYLIFYNFIRPHHSLDLKSPVEYLQQYYPLESKMYWTDTTS